jgi:undecaprenyl-diphosphatase
VNYWQALALGLVQGLTEFLPVSSSGHLVLTEALTGVRLPGVFVEVSLHVATLGSVLMVYGRRLWEIVRGVIRGQPDALRMAGLLALASVPAALVGMLFNDAIERLFDSPLAVGVFFVVTGLVLWSTRGRAGDVPRPDPARALAIGVAQAVAILPGISRSGSTVSMGLWARLSPVAAAEFSFLMAVPVIAGAAFLEGRHAPVGLADVGVGPFVLGLAAAFASGVFAIRFLVALLRRGRFYAFAPYCWAVGVFTIAYALWRP